MVRVKVVLYAVYVGQGGVSVHTGSSERGVAGRRRRHKAETNSCGGRVFCLCLLLLLLFLLL